MRPAAGDDNFWGCPLANREEGELKPWLGSGKVHPANRPENGVRLPGESSRGPGHQSDGTAGPDASGVAGAANGSIPRPWTRRALLNTTIKRPDICAGTRQQSVQVATRRRQTAG